jgi:hypothetical protein
MAQMDQTIRRTRRVLSALAGPTRMGKGLSNGSFDTGGAARSETLAPVVAGASVRRIAELRAW